MSSTAFSSACLSGGHVLLEGVPGLGKTTLLRTLGRVLHLKYSRIQFTPDLMPADIVGSMIMETDDRGSKMLKFQPGPIFANLVLADEINRATPKTQSALLEAMQERTVTSGTTTHQLERSVPRDGDAESDRDGRHLSAAGSAARPVPDEDRGELSVARRSEHDRRAHDSAGRYARSIRCSIATAFWICGGPAARFWSPSMCRIMRSIS